MTRDNVVQSSTVTKIETDLLERIVAVLPILADLSRADALLCIREGSEVRVLSHQRPHSLAPVHRTSLTGETITRASSPTIYDAFEQNRFMRGSRVHAEAEGAPVVQEAFPIRPDGRTIAAVLVVETNLLEVERMRRRNRVFQHAIGELKWMATRGQPSGAEGLFPFGEYDGVIFADGELYIRYMSGIATNLYRNIGYSESVVGRELISLETADHELAQQALASGQSVKRELVEKGRTWFKQAIPIQ